MGILAKLRHNILVRPLLNIYQPLINPYLYYGICAWGTAPKTYINKILLIQKRAHPGLLFWVLSFQPQLVFICVEKSLVFNSLNPCGDSYQEFD